MLHTSTDVNPMLYLICSVYVQMVDRKQSRLCLALVPVDCFVPVTSDPEMELSYYQECNTTYPPIQVIYEDTSDIWINVSRTKITLGNPSSSHFRENA